MEQAGFNGVLESHQGLGAGTGHGIRGKGELDKNNTEGKERIWRQKLDKLDGADSSEENKGKGTPGDGGFQGVGGFQSSTSHLHLFEKFIFDKRILHHAFFFVSSDCQLFCPRQ